MISVIAEIFIYTAIILGFLVICGFYLCMLGGWLFCKIKKLIESSYVDKQGSCDDQPWGF